MKFRINRLILVKNKTVKEQRTRFKRKRNRGTSLKKNKEKNLFMPKNTVSFK